MSSLTERAAVIRWFNAMAFPGFQTKGRDHKTAYVPNASLYGTLDLLSSIDVRGMRCIDIGAGSGLVALGLASRGAGYVASCDVVDHASIRLAIEASKLAIDHRIVGVEDLRTQVDWQGSFDLVVSSGLMYHLLSPFELIYAARKLLKPRGLFVLQTLTHAGSGMLFNLDRQVVSDYSTYFIPSRSCVDNMLRYSLFDVKARRFITDKSAFVAWLARAENEPSDVANRPALMQKAHEGYFKIGHKFGGYGISTLAGQATDINFEEPLVYDKTIDQSANSISWPFNPIQHSDKALGL